MNKVAIIIGCGAAAYLAVTEASFWQRNDDALEPLPLGAPAATPFYAAVSGTVMPHAVFASGMATRLPNMMGDETIQAAPDRPVAAPLNRSGTA
jgi:hypothetical protein